MLENLLMVDFDVKGFGFISLSYSLYCFLQNKSKLRIFRQLMNLLIEFWSFKFWKLNACENPSSVDLAWIIDLCRSCDKDRWAWFFILLLVIFSIFAALCFGSTKEGRFNFWSWYTEKPSEGLTLVLLLQVWTLF